MDYHAFFVGFGCALLMACSIWLLTVLRIDPVPEMPEPPSPEPAPEPKPKPARKRHARQTKKA
jgi:hypothetical protein